jgi:hypothetical protein
LLGSRLELLRLLRGRLELLRLLRGRLELLLRKGSLDLVDSGVDISGWAVVGASGSVELGRAISRGNRLAGEALLGESGLGRLDTEGLLRVLGWGATITLIGALLSNWSDLLGSGCRVTRLLGN